MGDKIQETAENLTRNEILLNVSHLVSELMEKLSGSYQEELMEVIVKDDWKSPVEEYVMNGDSDDLRQVLETLDDLAPGAYMMEASDLRPQVWASLETSDQDWQEIAEDLGLEPYEDEALEHWAVTDRLADDLEHQGEMVLKDFMGLNIWGRTCSGQAISDDGAMRRVAADLIERTSQHSLNFQEES